MNGRPEDFGELDRSRVRGLLFDVDGTLSDTDDHWVQRFTKHLTPFAGLFADRDPKRFARWLVMSVETPANFLYSLADRIGIDKPIFTFINWLFQKSRSRRAIQDRFLIIPGSQRDVGKTAREIPDGSGQRQGRENNPGFSDLFGLTPFFDVVVTAHTCEHTKPFPDPVIYAADALGLEPEQCLMIGDTIVDIKAGKLAGAQTVAVLCGFGQRQELERVGANVILDSTAELDGFLVSEHLE